MNQEPCKMETPEDWAAGTAEAFAASEWFRMLAASPVGAVVTMTAATQNRCYNAAEALEALGQRLAGFKRLGALKRRDRDDTAKAGTAASGPDQFWVLVRKIKNSVKGAPGYDEAAWVEMENMILHRMANMLQATAESHASRSSRDALISAAEEVVRLAKKEK